MKSLIEPGPTLPGSDDPHSGLAAVGAGIEIGDRVVVRYRLDDGRATDALGILMALDSTHCIVATKRGTDRIALDRIIAAKAVPPAPAPRPR